MSSSDNQITPFDGYGNDAIEVAGPGTALARPMQQQNATLGGAADLPAGNPPGMMKKVHTALRGRYWIAIVLGVVCGIVGGYFGFKSQQPIYRGEGLIQIAFSTPAIMTPSDRSGPMINFEEYLQSQSMLLSSRAIVNQAMKLQEWKQSGLGDDPAVHNVVAANLMVEHPTRTEFIRVYYTDKNPDVALRVVQSVVKAYSEYSQTKSTGEDAKRMNILDNRKALLRGQVERLDAQIMDAANVYGTPNLDQLVEGKLMEESKIESRMHEAELALEAAKRKKDVKQAVIDLTESQIAMIDQVMRGMMVERESILNEIARLEAAGIGRENVKMKQAVTLREAQQRKMEKYAAEWRDLQMRLSDDPSLAAGGIGRILPLSEKVIAGEVDSLKRKFEQLRQERTEIGRNLLKIQDLQRQREDLTKEKNDVQRRMDQLAIESNLAGRVTIVQDGFVPIAPFKDRRKMMGAAGAAGGFGIPMAFFILMGLLDRRYRYSDDANTGANNVPLLGILPRLPDQISDPEQAAVAAHCIHQIRIMLQVGSNPENRRVFMVTSASTGDGKTSLTMALGLSFAASGSKTLVVDCDMVGQGLTHRLKAHNVPGLIETLNLGTLRGHVRKTATKGLYVLPIGNADAVHAGVLSPQSIKRLLVACREHFDVIVIDTGPILGSLEASVVSTEADGVIMAVARGQQQPLVDKAVKHLRAIGANLLGIVFNRAEQRDFQRSVPSASIRSTSARQNEPRKMLPDSDESSHFGPLAQSVASCMPTHNQANGDS